MEFRNEAILTKAKLFYVLISSLCTNTKNYCKVLSYLDVMQLLFFVVIKFTFLRAFEKPIFDDEKFNKCSKWVEKLFVLFENSRWESSKRYPLH